MFEHVGTKAVMTHRIQHVLALEAVDGDGGRETDGHTRAMLARARIRDVERAER